MLQDDRIQRQKKNRITENVLDFFFDEKQQRKTLQQNFLYLFL